MCGEAEGLGTGHGFVYAEHEPYLADLALVRRSANEFSRVTPRRYADHLLP